MRPPFDPGIVPVEPVSPSQLVAVPAAPAAVFRLHGPPRKGGIFYRLSGYSGDVIGEGEAECGDGNLFNLPLPPEAGFYEYQFPEWEQRCGLLVQPEFTGEPDPFFGIDFPNTVFRHMMEPEEIPAMAGEYGRLLHRAGVGNIRDRLLWHRLEAAGPGKFDWNILDAETFRRIAGINGLRVLENFERAPSWSLAEGNPYPGDLAGVASSWRAIAAKFNLARNLLEVWNEPEGGLGAGLPGDQAGALLRTLSYALPEVPLVGGAFIGNNRSFRMLRAFLANGLAHAADALSFHDYDPPAALADKIADFRKALAAAGNEHLPLILSECGKPWPAGTPRAEAADDRRSALDLVRKAVEAKACGVRAFYAFVLQYYDEYANNFGMMDFRHTPMRSLAAYLTTVRFLSHAHYAGDLPGCGRVFRRGDTAVAALSAPADLPGDGYGIDGRCLRGKKFPDGFGYWIAPFAAVAPHLDTATEAMRLHSGAAAYRPALREAYPVVGRFHFNPQQMTWRVEGYCWPDPGNAVFECVFTNLAAEALTVRPRLRLPAGASIREGKFPEELLLAPGEAQSCAVILNLTEKEAELRVEDAAGRMAPLSVFCLADPCRRLAVPRRESFPPELARFDELGAEWTRLEGVDCWKSAVGIHVPSRRAAFRFGWNPEELLLEVLVDSPAFHQPFSAAEAWRADSLQLALRSTVEPGDRATELGAAAVAGRPVLFRHRSESGAAPAELTVSRLEFRNFRLYSLRLNREELGLPLFRAGLRLPCSLIVNAAGREGSGREGYLFWGDGIGNSKNTREFNQLILEEETSCRS